MLLAGLLLVSGCAAPDDDAVPASTTRGVRATLERRAAAVPAHDTDAYLAVVDPRATGLRTAQRRELDNLADVPLSSWTYRLTDVTAQGTDRATADVQLRYAIKGYDAAPVSVDRVLDLRRYRADGRWYLIGDRAGKDGAGQLWQQGDVRVVRGEHSLVLGVGRTQQELRGIARAADRAVPAVSGAWPERWAGRVLVLVPRTVVDMAGLLGSPAANYRGMAAVTTGRTGGLDRAPADRVIVNPQAYDVLSTLGQRIVLTHEIAHVATRARTSAATPTWLSEGFADWAAYRAEDRTAARAAPELADTVAHGELPAGLPTDEDFGFMRRLGAPGEGVRGRLDGLRADRRPLGREEAVRLLPGRRRVFGAGRGGGAGPAGGARHDSAGVHRALEGVSALPARLTAARCPPRPPHGC